MKQKIKHPYKNIPAYRAELIPLSTKDNIRKYLYSNRKLGTYTPYKVGDNQEWDANGALFGKRVGQGSEQDVFENIENPNEVLKIQKQGYANKSDMRKGVHEYHKRNRIPNQERTKFIGYMSGADRATYYPVFSQNRLRLETNTTPAYWDNVLVPKINQMMYSQGYNGTALTIFTNGKHTVSDMSPYNIGYDTNGNLKFIDFHVE